MLMLMNKKAFKKQLNKNISSPIDSKTTSTNSPIHVDRKNNNKYKQ